MVSSDDNNFHVNRVEAEGNITKLWSRSNGDILFRLAVYDEHTELLGETDAAGREKRKPHFLTVVVEDGKVGGRAVNLQKGDHVRVSGYLRDEVYFETLREFLLKAKAESVLNLLSQDVSAFNIKSGRVATQVVIDSLVQFTR